MAKLIIYFFYSLFILLLLAKASPAVFKHFSSLACEQFDYELNEKLSEKENPEPNKSFKSTEFIDSTLAFSFEKHDPTHTYYIPATTILYSILEIPKRPPRKTS
ncbi:hypothetical protein SAMN06297358_2285 [Pedobacter xixiisoli]|uniref:Uncharacterized protein n=1 Tax=Pedobacter xixiisoli TaxID=1476464 RepID=A0A286A087_9SPHI|nr:hypothetical protein SAMN06297358_2285 [Pedobacter xixiisoli]